MQPPPLHQRPPPLQHAANPTTITITTLSSEPPRAPSPPFRLPSAGPAAGGRVGRVPRGGQGHQSELRRQGHRRDGVYLPRPNLFRLQFFRSGLFAENILDRTSRRDPSQQLEPISVRDSFYKAEAPPRECLPVSLVLMLLCTRSRGCFQRIYAESARDAFIYLPCSPPNSPFVVGQLGQIPLHTARGDIENVRLLSDQLVFISGALF